MSAALLFGFLGAISGVASALTFQYMPTPLDLLPGIGFAIAVAVGFRLATPAVALEGSRLFWWIAGSTAIYLCMRFSFGLFSKGFSSHNAGFAFTGALGALLIVALFASTAAPLGMLETGAIVLLGALWAWVAMALNDRGFTLEWPLVLFVGWQSSIAAVLGFFTSR